MKLKDFTKDFERYDRTHKKMAEYTHAGNRARKSLRSTKSAAREDNWDRAKFITRKASQILTAGHPLKDESGTPTPAALQFKRWAAKVPQNQADVRELKALGERLKARYKPKK